MNGHEVLREIRADHTLRHLPIVVMTTSRRDEDILASYQLGANAFVTKPDTYKGLVAVMRATCDYWLRVAQLPAYGES
jgi:two-component system response regulator